MKALKSILPFLIVATLSSCTSTASAHFAAESIVMGLIGIVVVSCIIFFVVVSIIKKETPAIVVTVIIMLFLLGMISAC